MIVKVSQNKHDDERKTSSTQSSISNFKGKTTTTFNVIGVGEQVVVVMLLSCGSKAPKCFRLHKIVY